MRRIVLASTAALAMAAAACSESQAQAGPAVSRSFPVASFSSLEVSGPFEVSVTTGAAPSVRAQGSQQLLDAMEVVVSGDRLQIRTKRRGGWFGGMSWSGKPATVAVTVPALTAVSVTGSGDTKVDRVSGDSFSGAIAGSGDLKLGQVAVKSLNLAIAGSGEVTAAGRADRANYTIAGSGDVHAAGLTATSAAAEVAGSGNVRARVTGEATARIMGSGDIDISGGAKCQSTKHGSGNIRCS